MRARPRLGLLGGTFDPIHAGHLAAARAAQQELALESLRFIPSARPPHRTDSPRASEYHRMEMIRLAVADATAAGQSTRWEISDLELQRPGQSYTYDTLHALAAEGLTPLQMFFIIGADAFADIATWHRYPDVLDSAHFAVVTRPGTTLTQLKERLPALATRMLSARELTDSTTTRIILIESATPDVSSTEIRARVARNESIAGLVSPSVAAYISQNQLYCVTSFVADAPGEPDAPGARTEPGAPSALGAPDAPDAPDLGR
jgi:nicotinate-nucleotide adenylyltransferase